MELKVELRDHNEELHTNRVFTIDAGVCFLINLIFRRIYLGDSEAAKGKDPFSFKSRSRESTSFLQGHST